MSTTTYYLYDKSNRMTRSYPSGATGESRYFTYNERNMVTQIQDVNTAGGADANRYFSYNGVGERVMVVDGLNPCYWAYDKRKLIADQTTIGAKTYFTHYRSNFSTGPQAEAATNDVCPPPLITTQACTGILPKDNVFCGNARGNVEKVENYDSDGDQFVNSTIFNAFGLALNASVQAPYLSAMRMGFLGGRGLLTLTTSQPLMVGNNGTVYDPKLGQPMFGVGGMSLLMDTMAGLGVDEYEGGGGGGALRQDPPNADPKPSPSPQCRCGANKACVKVVTGNYAQFNNAKGFYFANQIKFEGASLPLCRCKQEIKYEVSNDDGTAAEGYMTKIKAEADYMQDGTERDAVKRFLKRIAGYQFDFAHTLSKEAPALLPLDITDRGAGEQNWDGHALSGVIAKNPSAAKTLVIKGLFKVSVFDKDNEKLMAPISSPDPWSWSFTWKVPPVGGDGGPLTIDPPVCSDSQALPAAGTAPGPDPSPSPAK